MLMRAAHEPPVNTMWDAYARGENIWVRHTVPDPSKPDETYQWVLMRLNAGLQEYISAAGTTYWRGGDGRLPKHVWDDVQDNGASVVLGPVR